MNVLQECRSFGDVVERLCDWMVFRQGDWWVGGLGGEYKGGLCASVTALVLCEERS